MRPTPGQCGANLALTLHDLGRHDDAIRAIERALDIDVDQFSVGCAVCVYIGADADRSLTRLLAMREASAYVLATAYACLDDHEQSFQALERAYEERDESVADVGMDPVFAAMHDDPRMTRLLARRAFRNNGRRSSPQSRTARIDRDHGAARYALFLAP